MLWQKNCCINCDDKGNCAFADCKCHGSGEKTSEYSKGKLDFIQKLMEHKFQTYTSTVSLISGNQVFSIAGPKTVIDVKELTDYLLEEKNLTNKMTK